MQKVVIFGALTALFCLSMPATRAQNADEVEKLRRENTIFTLPNLNLGGIPGSIAVYLSYTYSNREAKGSVDREVLSHFDANYLWGGFSDPERGFIMLSAPSQPSRGEKNGNSTPVLAKARPMVASIPA